MAEFSLVTVWEIAAPLQRVWDAIYRADDWPKWWPYVEDVATLAAGDGDGVGAVHRLTWRTRLPYRITFDTRATVVEPPFALDARAFGDLEGCGRWRLSRQGSKTIARYVWDVRITRPWMDRVAGLARSVFEWNHHGVMRAGGEGLARYLASSETDRRAAEGSSPYSRLA
ncbi:MAG TPA: SRPBCC family protein [Burkholderiales bacterium]|nr:SRPBCC family protein [Burkholderiales bacterium]